MPRVHYGGGDMFGAMVYGETTEATRSFLESQFDRPTQYLSEGAARFQERAKSLYDRAKNSRVGRLMKAAGRKMQSSWRQDKIFAPQGLHDLQHARATMQRWNMANPNLRTVYHRQMCDGYSDTYVDMEPKAVGEAQYDYRRATNGLVMDTEKGWVVTNHFEDIYANDRELTFEEQCDIQESWEMIDSYLDLAKEDPTSKFAALLS